MLGHSLRIMFRLFNVNEMFQTCSWLCILLRTHDVWRFHLKKSHNWLYPWSPIHSKNAICHVLYTWHLIETSHFLQYIGIEVENFSKYSVPYEFQNYYSFKRYFTTHWISEVSLLSIQDIAFFANGTHHYTTPYNQSRRWII